jgi:hypothetical protein
VTRSEHPTALFGAPRWRSRRGCELAAGVMRWYAVGVYNIKLIPDIKT